MTWYSYNCIFNLFHCLLYTLESGRRMRTVINMYIGNLAMADVIIAVFCIPFQFQAALLYRWNLPAFLCKLCPFLQVSEVPDPSWGP